MASPAVRSATKASRQTSRRQRADDFRKSPRNRRAKNPMYFAVELSRDHSHVKGTARLCTIDSMKR